MWKFASISDAGVKLSQVNSFREVSIDVKTSSFLQLMNSNFAMSVETILESSAAVVNVYNSSFGRMSITGSAPVVTLLDNTFSSGVMIDGPTMTVDIRGNSFSAVAPPGSLMPASNLFLYTRCDASGQLLRNRFISGTLYFFLPTDAERVAAGCTEQKNIYAKLTARFNQFAAHGQYGNASASVIFDMTTHIPTSHYPAHMIDLTKNWWGDVSGPKLCCNPNGIGAYPTQLISPNYWCTDPDCNGFSSAALPNYCLISCCTQPKTKAATTTVIFFAVIAYAVLLASIVYSIIYMKMTYTSEAFKFGRQEDMLDKIVPRLLVGVGASTVGGISILIISWLLCSTYWTVKSLPRQEKYTYQGVFIGFVFTWTACLQFIANILMFSSILLRYKYPKYIRFVSSKVFIWCGLNIAYVLVASMVWLPYARILPKPCSMVNYVDIYSLSVAWYTSYPTPTHAMLTIALIPCGLISLAVGIPLQMFNNLLYNFEYSCINSALETALLKDLAKSATIAKKARNVRIAACCTLLLGIANLVAAAYLIAVPSMTPTEATYWPLSILVWGVPRFINTVAACVIGVGILLTAIWLTFSYNRATLLNIITFLTLSVGIAIVDSNIAEFPAYGMLQTNKSRAFVLRGTPQALGDLFGFGCFVTFIFLFKLSNSVIHELPKIAITNLNTHLDEAWSGSGRYALLSDSDLSELSQ